MPLDRSGWRNWRTWRGIAVAAITASFIEAAPQDDPPPGEDELLTMPGPEAPPEANGRSPFELLPAVPESLVITGEHLIFYDATTETVTYDGEVAIRTDTGLQLFADRGFLDLRNKFIRVSGNVTVYQGPSMQRGEVATYFYEEERLDAESLRAGVDPFLLESGRFKSVERDGRLVFVGEDAALTTHDYEDPSFWVRARKITLYPDDRVDFQNMTLLAGGVPVFWLPYLSQPLHEDLGYHFPPGASTTWGPYLLNRYGIMLGGRDDEAAGKADDPWLLSQWHFDLRAKRGLGLGLDLFDTRLDDNPNLGWLKTYYINDLDPDLARSDEERSGVNENRFRVQLRHRLGLESLFPEGDAYLEADLTVLSDRFYLEDFNRFDFRIEPNPDNHLAFVRRLGRNLFTAWVRVRPNDFYTSDTRLPELAFDQVRHPLWGGPVLHEGQFLFGIYKSHLPDFQRTILRAEREALDPDDPRREQFDFFLADRGFSRLHLWQELSLPLTLERGLHLVPRAGVGYTGYWSVSGGGRDTNRRLVYTGLDSSLKFSRTFPDFKFRSLGVDGLLHVVQPYANLSWVATDDLDPSFRGIDRLAASTRPRPLGVGRFTAIDDLTDWTIVRLGARNRLLTRRDTSTHEWLILDTYFDWFLEDPEFSRKFSNLYNNLYFRPLPWLSFIFETQFPLLGDEGDFTELAAALRYMPTPNLDFEISHRFLNDHPILENSSRLEYNAYARLNENWGLGFLHRWEFDDNTLELQQYALHRTLQNWAVSLGLFHRDNRSEDEYGFLLGFTLSEFPNIHFPLQIDSE